MCDMRLSKRLEKIPPYLFVEVDRKIDEQKAKGVDVISFGVGDPDEPTPAEVIDILCKESRKPEHHQYPSYFGLDAFRRACAEWFERRFGVPLDPASEILPLVGSKEGIAHLALALVDPGDTVLVPEPGYPVYEMGTLLAGGEPYLLPLRRENNFLPDIDSVSGEGLRAKVMWLNYPNNPTGAVAERSFLERAVRFAHDHDMVLAYDNAYSEITYDGFEAPSLLQVEGSRELGIEFHSLSKSFNMTGWRVGFACGGARVIEALGTIKTNIDSGIFNPIQLAGITALGDPSRTARRMRDTYNRRRNLLLDAFRGMGIDVVTPRGGIYIWLPVPPGFDSVGFSTHVLEKAGIFFTPGNAYGPSGEGYVRVSLTVPDDRIAEAVARLRDTILS